MKKFVPVVQFVALFSLFLFWLNCSGLKLNISHISAGLAISIITIFTIRHQTKKEFKNIIKNKFQEPMFAQKLALKAISKESKNLSENQKELLMLTLESSIETYNNIKAFDG